MSDVRLIGGRKKKQCGTCLSWRDLINFKRLDSTPDGFNSTCKACLEGAKERVKKAEDFGDPEFTRRRRSAESMREDKKLRELDPLEGFLKAYS